MTLYGNKSYDEFFLDSSDVTKILLRTVKNANQFDNVINLECTQPVINNCFNNIYYDWVHRLYIWRDDQDQNIKIINSIHKNIIYEFENSFYKSFSVINVKKSVLLWSIVGPEPKLIETNYDGTNDTFLYSNWRPVRHLTVDYRTDRYYLVDIRDFSLYSIDFNGNNEIFYMKSENLFDDINGLSVWDNDLYLSNRQLIYKIPEFSAGVAKAEILYKTYSFEKIQRILPQIKEQEFYEINSNIIKRQEFKALYVYPPESGLNFTNKCESNVCSHLCLPIGSSYRCVCPSDYVLVNESQCLTEEELKITNEISNKLDHLYNIDLEPKLKQNQNSTEQINSTDSQVQDSFPNKTSEKLRQSELDHVIAEMILFKDQYTKLQYSCNSNIFSTINFILIVSMFVLISVIIY